MANLAKIKRTMIFIAHRNSVRQHVSRVVTMVSGQIESDSPNFNPFRLFKIIFLLYIVENLRSLNFHILHLSY